MDPKVVRLSESGHPGFKSCTRKLNKQSFSLDYFIFYKTVDPLCFL